MPKLLINSVLQRSFKKLFWKQGQKVLRLIQEPVLELAGNIEPDQLKARVKFLLKPEPVKEYVSQVWVKTGAAFAVDTIKRVHKVARKQEIDLDFWEEYFRYYTRERSAMIAGEILDTQAALINNLIDSILEDAHTEGAGIPEIMRSIRDDLENGLTVINNYQSERIARTEVIGSSNKGSFDGALQTGVDMQKEWINSGLPGMRQSHIIYGSMGAQRMDFQYAPGLRHPGDPEGSADEVINCRCTIGYIVD